MEYKDDAAQHREASAVADLVKFLGGMLLMASLVFLVLGAISYEQDRRERKAMIPAVATVTEEYVHGGAYYVTYEVDGTAYEALLSYSKGKLNAGDQVPILYDPEWYRGVRQDKPKTQCMNILGFSALGLALGGLAMFWQAHLRIKHDNPWHDVEA